MDGDNLRVGFFVEDTHYVLAESEVDPELGSGLEALDPDYEDGRGMVMDYGEAEAVLDGAVDGTEVKEEVLEDYPFALAYLNEDLEEELEEDYGSNGVVVGQNWSGEVEDRVSSGEYSMEDFDLGEAKVAVTHGEDLESLRRSYMRETIWDRNFNPAAEMQP